VLAFSVLDGAPDLALDFDLDGGDTLDLSALLPAFAAGDAIGDFVDLASAADGTLVAVDPSGGGADFAPVVVLQGVAVDSLSAAQLGLPEAPAG
jgi:hypothetical protein